ncbi:MAG: hypothetical protein R3E79_14345 [Caldilineaceae bacterium]
MRVTYADYMQTEEWRQRAEAAKARVGYRCQICNRASPRVILEVHHRTYERLGHEQPEDLTVLCRGCHELYESNRRMPRPPAALPERTEAQEKLRQQPMPVEGASPPAEALKVDQHVPASDPQPPHVPVQSRNLFVPAKADPQHTTRAAYRTQPHLLNQSDQHYQLQPEVGSDQPKSRYQLQLGTPANALAYQIQIEGKSTLAHEGRPTQSSRHKIGIAVVAVLLLLIVIGRLDSTQQAPLAIALPSPTNTAQPTPSHIVAPSPTPAPPIVSATATPVPTILFAPTVAPVTTTVAMPIPTLAPTLPPPTAAPVVTAVPKRTVNQTALVCGTPCSCAPVVRTITRGAEVTILETANCQGDTWYKIADEEWLGPRLLDDDTIMTPVAP